MSGFQAFESFVNYVKTQLAGSGITVDILKTDVTTPPYLIIQDGPENIRNKWLSSKLCQGWLVVQKNDTEDLIVTMGKATNKVIQATQDSGGITKYDYSTDPERAVGIVFPSVFELTAPMLSKDDPARMKRVITWELRSNSST
jgi:hypothetical protein